MSERSRDAGRESPARRRARIREDLERLGVGVEMRDELSRRLATLASRLTPEAYDAALAGVVLAHGMHRGRRNGHDLQEIQRMLAGFADELRKVDEALRILSTYVSRMRSRTAPEGSRMLH